MPGVTTAYQSGVHGSRPAASAGCILYACSTHSLIYRSDGSTWTTWMTIGSSTTTVATDAIWDAKGDLAVGTGADAASKLTAGSDGMVPVYDSAQSSGLKTAYPPGYELAYAQITATVNVTATTEAGADTVVSAAAVSFDGSTAALISFYSPYLEVAAANRALDLCLYDGSSSIGILDRIYFNAGTTDSVLGGTWSRRLTPSNASHTYSIRAYTGGGTSYVGAGAGGSGNWMPAYVRITRV